MLDGTDSQAMLDAAVAATGLSDFGDEWFRGPLDAWSRDLQQPNLTPFGRGFLRALAVRDLTRRLRVLNVLHQHPEIEDTPLPPIIYITGPERSGTTLLHNLLACHRGARTLLRWELMEPCPPPTAANHARDPRIALVQGSIDKLRGSLLERMHWVNADEPEECVWGFIDSVGMLGQAAGLCMPQWTHALRDRDPTPAYRNYRRLVQLLLWRNPVAQGGFLVLKAPQIALHIAAFAAVFPEARFVVTDRDPFRCVVSLAAMGHSIIAPFCVDNPLSDDGRRQRRVQTHVALKLPALDAFTRTAPVRVVHVAYPRLMAEPAATARGVFDGLDIAAGETLPSRIDAFLQAQRSGARAAPPGELPTMGYDQDELLADPAIADYCRRYAVEPERARLTGSHASA
jgi:hypothetical protein